MDWSNALSGILQRYSGAGGGTAAAPEDAHHDFQQVAQSAPKEVVAEGIEHAIRSDQTPAFPEMVSNVFTQSDPNRRAGLLNELLGSLGPGGLSGIPGLSALQGLLRGGNQITPQQASQVPAPEVQEVAAHAMRYNPSAVSQVSGFFAEHPEVWKAAGGLALAMAIQHIARRR
jgi:hypothetical protein